MIDYVDILVYFTLNYVTYLNSLGKEYGTPCMYIQPTKKETPNCIYSRRDFTIFTPDCKAFYLFCCFIRLNYFIN